MDQDKHREEVIRLLTKLNERQLTIFNNLKRIDSHLEKLNGKVEKHESSLIQVKTWGAVALVALPVIVNIAMRIIE